MAYFILDHGSKTVQRDGVRYSPARRQWDVLVILTSHPDWLYARYQLLDMIGSSLSDDRNIDSYVKHIRAGFREHGWPEDAIIARASFGYMWNAKYTVKAINAPETGGTK